MAIKHYDITLEATATQITSTTATRKGVRQMVIQNTSGNSAIYLGDSTVTSTTYGYSVANGGTLTLGPFSGSAPYATDELYIFGTAQDVVHILVVTH